MDQEHLAAALRYVALNPVRARLVERAADWRWSSVAAQLGLMEGDGATTTTPVRTHFPDFAALLPAGEEETAFAALRRAESIDRPIGNTDFSTDPKTSPTPPSGRLVAAAKPRPSLERINALST